MLDRDNKKKEKRKKERNLLVVGDMGEKWK